MNETPRSTLPIRKVGAAPSEEEIEIDDLEYAPGPSSVPRKRDPFPVVMGALLGATVFAVGLLLVLLANQGGGSPATSVSAPVPPVLNGQPGGEPAPTSAPEEAAPEGPPRITLEEFKALYDDPAKRPVILDVRPREAYEGGHIKDAIAFPEAEMDARVSELPKDKLIVAYCA